METGPIVLDAANVAMAYGRGNFRCKGIELAKQQLEALGYDDVRAVISEKAPLGHEFDEPELLTRWEQEGWLTRVAPPSHDDDTCLALGQHLRCPIVSRDLYRAEVARRKPAASKELTVWLKEHHYQFRWSKDTFLLLKPGQNSKCYSSL